MSAKSDASAAAKKPAVVKKDAKAPAGEKKEIKAAAKEVKKEVKKKEPEGKKKEVKKEVKKEQPDEKDEKEPVIKEKSVKQLRGDVAVGGYNWGEFKVEEKNLRFIVEDKPAFSIPLTSVSQSVIQSKNEVALELLQDETSDMGESLVEMRIFFPPAPDTEDENAAVQEFNKLIIEKAEIGTQDDCIATFEKCLFLVPRGRYMIQLFVAFLKISGKTFKYQIPYKTINKMFIFAQPDGQHHVLVIGLDPPIRQGRTSYPYLLLQFESADRIELEVNIEKKKLEEEYKDFLEEVMTGPTYEIICRVLKALTNKKVMAPAPNFKSSEGYSCISCNYKANNGHLFILNKSFFFIKKPPVYIRHDEIVSVEFKRAAAASSSRSFDLIINHRDNNTQNAFTSIDRQEYNALFDWIREKKLNILNEEDSAKMKTTARDRAAKPTNFTHDAYMQQLEDEVEDGDGKAGVEEDSEDDEDFEADEKADESSESDEDLVPEIDESEAQKSGGAAEEDEDGGDVIDDDDGEGKKKKPKKKDGSKKKKKKDEGGDGEKKKKRKKKKSGVKKAATAFLIFSNENRARIKTDNQGVSFGDVGRLLGAEWKKLTEEAKKPYEEKALLDKERYAKELAEAPPEPESDNDEEDSGKKKKKKKVKKKLKEGEPKKPHSAYITFGADVRKRLNEEAKAKGEKMAQKLIIQKIGEEWKNLDFEKKQIYVDRHKQELADYKAAYRTWQEEHKNDPPSPTEPSSPKKKEKKKKEKRKREDGEGTDGTKKIKTGEKTEKKVKKEKKEGGEKKKKEGGEKKKKEGGEKKKEGGEKKKEGGEKKKVKKEEKEKPKKEEKEKPKKEEETTEPVESAEGNGGESEKMESEVNESETVPEEAVEAVETSEQVEGSEGGEKAE